MIEKRNKEEVKERILELLGTIKRQGIDVLTNYLKQSDYFDAPASTKFHGNYAGGLAEHCLNIYNMFSFLAKQYKLHIDEESIILTSILHDICKVGKYQITNGRSEMNPYFIHKGHSRLSLKRIAPMISLTQMERDIIMYHMGFYGSNEFNRRTGEYSLREMTDIYNKNPVAKLFYFCDDMCSAFVEEKRG